MAQTPKKFVESGSKCFTCSLLCTVNEEIFIFGKNAANFAEIIQSAANININCSDNSDLFICKRVCHVISRAADNLPRSQTGNRGGLQSQRETES